MSFPMVPLGEVLTKSDEWTELDPQERYRQVTVRLWGKGVVLRAEVSGAEIAAHRMNVVRPQQFILSRIDARNGAFGLVPNSLDGAIVSSDFPVFKPDRSRILPKYIEWMSKTEFFVDLCRKASEGTTNRVRLKEDRFLAAGIPLPPLTDQRRIVARIEAVAARLDEAKGLRNATAVRAETITLGVKKAVTETFESVRLGDCIDDASNGLSRRPAGDEHGPIVLRLADVSSGVIDLSSPRRGVVSNAEAEKYSLVPGDLLFVRVNGSLSIVGRCVPVASVPEALCYNDHLIRVRLKPNSLAWRFACMMANASAARDFIENHAITTAGQFTVNQGMIAAIPVPIPPMTEQRRIVAYLDGLQAKVDELAQLQSETAAELDALMPAILDKAFRGNL